MLKILIIEDDTTLNDEISEFIQNEGYKPITGHSEQEALDILEKYGPTIAIAIVDMHHPAKANDLNNKESGLRLIQEMSAKYPYLVAIVHTGHGDLENAAKCMEAGAFSYLPKGGPPEELLAKVQKAEKRYKENIVLRHIETGIRPQVKEVKKILHNILCTLDRLPDELPEEDNTKKANGESNQ